MLLLMPCGFHLAETSGRMGARRPARPGYEELTAVRRGQVFALDGSAYFSRPGPRVIDGIELLAEIFDPGRVRRHRAVRLVDAGRRRSAMPFRATFDCLWCGTAAHRAADRTTSRAGRSSVRTASARPATTGSCGSGCARR